MAAPQLSDQAAMAEPVNPDSVASHLKCSCCTEIVFNAFQTPHGCRICQNCYNTKLKDTEKIRCPGNTEACRDEDEEDEIMISKQNCFPDIATRREIGKLEVKCPNTSNGCRQTSQWRKLDDHLINCDYQSVKCDQCKELVIKREMQRHNEEMCKFRKITCDLCQNAVTVNDFESGHKQLESEQCCPRFQSLCPHCQDRSVGQLTRQAYLEHLVNCKDKPDQCKFAHNGCSFMGKKDDLARHYEESMDYHLELIDKMIQQYRNNQQATATAAAAAAAAAAVSSLPAQSTTGATAATAAAAGGGGVSNSEIDKAVRNFTIQYEMFKKLQINVANWAHTAIEFKELSDKYGGVSQLRNYLQSLNDRLDRLPALPPSASAAAAAAAAAQNSSGSSGNFNQLSGQLVALQKSVKEVSFRLQNLETTSYDGRLVWKFPNFSARRAEARDRRVSSVFSQPFFDKPLGHQFRIRVFLNGEGPAENHFLSIALVVMQSQYDDILDWPLEGSVQFRLYNLKDRSQDVVKKVSIVDGKRPANSDDVSVSWFERKFVKLSDLEARDKFVKADCMFIGAEVDCTVGGGGAASAAASSGAGGGGGGGGGGGSGKKSRKR